MDINDFMSRMSAIASGFDHDIEWDQHSVVTHLIEGICKDCEFGEEQEFSIEFKKNFFPPHAIIRFLDAEGENRTELIFSPVAAFAWLYMGD